MDFYTKIETLRKERGFSQGALERELGFSNGSISKWKHSIPTYERLKKLADFFQVSIDYLAGDETKADDAISSLDSETAQTAFQIYTNDKVLFDVYRSSDKERLVAYAKKLQELRELETNL